jgi:bacteriorhodopsin
VNETTWFWIGTVGMGAGAVLLTALGKKRTQDEEAHTVIHGVVPLIAALAYFSMAIGQGGTTLADGRLFWFARYVDWSVTTPLLLLGLCITALHGAHRRRALVTAVLGADVIMIATGLFSGLSTESFPRYTWFLISCGAFLALYMALFAPLRREAQARDEQRRHSYLTSSVVLAVLWLLYPVIVLLGPDGVGSWSPTVTTGTITVVDLLAKVGYGLLLVRFSKADADGDLARAEVTAAPVTSHGVPSHTGLAPRP